MFGPRQSCRRGSTCVAKNVRRFCPTAALVFCRLHFAATRVFWFKDEDVQARIAARIVESRLAMMSANVNPGSIQSNACQEFFASFAQNGARPLNWLNAIRNPLRNLKIRGEISGPLPFVQTMLMAVSRDKHFRDSLPHIDLLPLRRKG